MAKKARLKVALIKLESTYSVDPTPDPTQDALLLRSIKVSPIKPQHVERRLIRPFFGSAGRLLAKKWVEIEMEMEMAGFGTAGPASPLKGYDAALRICGHARTVTAGTKVDYSLVSSGLSSATIYYYQDGLFHKATGAFGDLTMVWPLNDVPLYRIRLMALYNNVVDAALPAPAYTGWQKPVLVNAQNTTGLSLQGYAGLKMTNLEIGYGVALSHRNLVNATESIEYTDRNLTGKMTVEAESIAAKDWFAALNNEVLAPLSITHGPATNQVKFDGPAVQVTEIDEEEDQDNIIMRTFSLSLPPTSAGSDEAVISVR